MCDSDLLVVKLKLYYSLLSLSLSSLITEEHKQVLPSSVADRADRAAILLSVRLGQRSRVTLKQSWIPSNLIGLLYNWI